ncbi:hypothetical protein CLCR_06621 [Cladophialophora carrionii]|uniref:Heterokaryon incompatibility domain-containing protein n=1 Tax=Cladophialophora carrionii TaxID=86049 RepID=A0A1C1CNL1_9EURO|nr:hypothetical protein CLCR_06621 [Cladophialophora carrionii]
MLSRISLEDLLQLEEELEDSPPTCSPQIGVDTRRAEILMLWVAARKTRIRQKGWDTGKNGRVGIAGLRIRALTVQYLTPTQKILPTRLLDVSSALSDDHIMLCGSQSLRVGVKCATLRHCWGGQCNKRLTMKKLSQFQQGIPLSDLPRTFRDEMFVTTRLGLHFLWIDALCTIQAWADDADWIQEASTIGDVYANPRTTIAAITSRNSEGGLLHGREKSTLDLEPLASRSWAFQEWLFSKRLLHFGKHQVRWQCFCLAASEVYHGGGSGDDGGLDAYVVSKKGIISQKALTNATERLPALTGIARMVHKILNSTEDDYLAGIWKPHLLQESLWQSAHHTPASAGTDTFFCRIVLHRKTFLDSKPKADSISMAPASANAVTRVVEELVTEGLLPRTQVHLDILDLNEFPIEEINATGIRTAAGQVDVDLIVLATGFDGLTGGFMDIDLRGVDGRTLKQHWSEGVKTSVGVAVPGFPNMLFLFGPQAPSPCSNGPSCIHFQGRWFEKLIQGALAEGVDTIEATEESANDWVEKIRERWEATLLPQGKISLLFPGDIPVLLLTPLHS